MTGDTALLVALVGWLLIGLVLALVLGRRGHDPLGWFILGALLGPLAILLALDAVEHDERPVLEVLAPPVGHSDGGIDVLVGFDGSAASQAAFLAADRLLGDRVDRLTLATVVPYDSGRIDDREARSKLLDEVRAMPARGVGLEVAHGRPAAALRQLAERDDYELIVVGTSSDERLHALGDAAVDLARDSVVPVLLVPPPQTGENDDHE